MGRYIVKLPDIGEGTTEAEIVAWHVAPGQEIREEDPLVDVMTDKATVEIPAPIGGTVVALGGAVGDKRPVGSELVTLDVAGEGNVRESPHPATANAAATLSRGAGEGSGRGTGVPKPVPLQRTKNDRGATKTLSRIAGEGGEAPRAEPGA